MRSSLPLKWRKVKFPKRPPVPPADQCSRCLESLFCRHHMTPKQVLQWDRRNLRLAQIRRQGADNVDVRWLLDEIDRLTNFEEKL